MRIDYSDRDALERLVSQSSCRASSAAELADELRHQGISGELKITKHGTDGEVEINERFGIFRIPFSSYNPWES